MKTQLVEKKVNLYSLIVYFVTLSLFVIIRACASGGLFGFLGDYGSYFLSLFLQIGIVFLVPVVMFKIITKSRVKDVFNFCLFRKTSIKIILISFVLGIIIYFLNTYVSSFFNTLIQFFGYKPTVGGGVEIPATWWRLLLDLLCTAVLPAIAEETLHRGLLLNGVSMLGIRKSLIISGCLFGLFHLNIQQCFYAIVIGIFLGYLAFLSNSIYPCIIVHFMNNAISVFMGFARDKGWAIGYANQIFASETMLGILISILVFCLLLYVAWMLVVFIMEESFNFNFGKKSKELANLAIRENYFQQIKNIKNDNYNASSDKAVVNVKLEDLMSFTQKNVDSSGKPLNLFPKFEMSLGAKIILWGCFALSIIVTIMTFVWGLLA